MATTARDIIEGSYGYSTKNQPNEIATETVELLGVVQRALHRVYEVAAEANPYYFASSAAVPFAASGWARPSTAELIWRIEDTTSAEVVVVPREDLLAEPETPAVYRFGQVYYPAGNAGDPASGNLTFFYSRQAQTLTDIDDTVEAAWPERFNQLLIIEVATYLAHKDARQEEVQWLVSEYGNWLQLFAAHLGHETANEVRRFGHMPVINTEFLIPFIQTMGGGS